MEDDKHALLYCLRARATGFQHRNTTTTTLTAVGIASIFFADKAQGILHINNILRQNLALVFTDIFRGTADYVSDFLILGKGESKCRCKCIQDGLSQIT